MSTILAKIRRLVASGHVRISSHGYDELADDGILVRDLIVGIEAAMPVEDYPQYPKGPCVLVLQHDRDRNPVHVVWGIPKGKDSPAVLITAYRPKARLWSSDFLRRKRS